MAYHIALALLLTGSLCHGEKSLEMVHMVYRHGARSPIHSFPNDPNPPSVWPDGPGRLTPYGMTLEYGLGRFLKKRYVETRFLNQLYLHNEVYIQSSDEERCLQSAETQLAGLYPPSGRQVWNEGLGTKWQPVPVHTVRPDKDPWLRPDDTDCPRLQQLFEERYDKPEFKEVQAKNKDLVAMMTKETGMPVDLKNFWEPMDTLICEITQNLTIPQWATENWNRMMNVADWLFLYQYRGSDELGRLLGGFLLGYMESNMKMWSQHHLRDDLHIMNIFSGHDTSVLSLMTALNIDLPRSPPFAACVIIELYQDDSNYFVEIVYRNDSSDTVHELKLKDCAFSCPLDEFIAKTKARIPENRDLECKVDTFSKFRKLSKRTDVRIASLSAVIGTLALIIILIAFIWRRRNTRQRRLAYKVDATSAGLLPSHGDRERLIAKDSEGQ